MNRLRVIVDQLLAPVPGGIGRYTLELTNALIDTAPEGTEVTGVVSAAAASDLRRVRDRLPGLAGLETTLLGRRALATAWRYGLADLPGADPVHATSMLAPLRAHRRSPARRTVVTVHDVVPWTHPETLTPRGVAWHKAMAGRAWRHADAVVVPTEAVAGELTGLFDFGDRIRVIGGAVSSRLALPADADERAERLALPGRFVLAVGTLEPRKGLEPLIRSFAVAGATELPLLVAGPSGWGGVDVPALARLAGLPPGRVRALGLVSDEDLAVLLDRASVFAFPSLAEGFGLPVLEAFSFGTPVVHSDAPAVAEVAGGAGLCVPRAETATYPERLAEAIAAVDSDAALRERLSHAGRQRAGAFSWQESAARVWRLHAEL